MRIRDIYTEYSTFITSAPPLEAIAAYRFSEPAEQYINSLLEARASRRLTAGEQAELDEYAILEHLMRLIKLKVLEKLQ